MKQTKEGRKEKKIRRLYRKLKDIGFYSGSGEKEVLSEPEVIRTSDSKQARENAEYAKALFERFGGDGPYQSSYWRHIGRSRSPSFLTISEEKYLELPATLNPLYERVRKVCREGKSYHFEEETFKRLREKEWTEIENSRAPGLGGTLLFGETKSVDMPTFRLKDRYRSGWEIKPGEVQYYFDPQLESRRAELKRRIEEIGDDHYSAVLRKYIYGPSHWTRERWGKDKQKLRERDLDRDMEKEITHAATEHLYEVRTTKNTYHCYLTIERGADGIGPYGDYEPGHLKMAREDPPKDNGLGERLRRNGWGVAEVDARLNGKQVLQKTSQPTVEERLNGSAEKLRELKETLE